jgi:hypothetical protein
MADVRYQEATRIYDGADTPAVDNLDLDIEDGRELYDRPANTFVAGRSRSGPPRSPVRRPRSWRASRQSGRRSVANASPCGPGRARRTSSARRPVRA